MIYKKPFILFLLGFSFSFLSSCADQITSEDDLLNRSAQTIVGLSKLSEIQNKVFTPNCAVSGCHEGSNPQAELNLSQGNSFANLVNVASILNPPLKLVEPGNAGSSFLIKVLTWEGNVKMPLDAPQLPQNVIDSIKVWINKGAPND